MEKKAYSESYKQAPATSPFRWLVAAPSLSLTAPPPPPRGGGGGRGDSRTSVEVQAVHDTQQRMGI